MGVTNQGHTSLRSGYFVQGSEGAPREALVGRHSIRKYYPQHNYCAAIFPISFEKKSRV